MPRKFTLFLMFVVVLAICQVVYVLQESKVPYFPDIFSHLPVLIGHTSTPQTYIFIAADNLFQQQNQLQMDTIRCYSERHGYKVIVSNLKENKMVNDLLVNDCCQKHKDFFFKRHCVLACYMESIPSNAHIFLFDSDVMVGLTDVSLDHWKNGDFDISYFERRFSGELMAGGYCVKNTLIARNFLRRWANYEFSRPPGFSSADNGAIHVALLEYFGLARKCVKRFYKLTADAMDLHPYFSFVSCARHALGMGSFEDGEYLGMGKFLGNNQEFRKNGAVLVKRGGLSVKIFQRGYSWMQDINYGDPNQLKAQSLKEHRTLPVFNHGVKKGIHIVLKYWEINNRSKFADKKTVVKSGVKTEVFPLCRPRENYGKLPKEFQNCVKKNSESDRKCIDNVVLRGERGIGTGIKSQITNN